MRKSKVYILVAILSISLVFVASAALAAEHVTSKNIEESKLLNIPIGQSKQAVLELLGEPSRIDISEYGFEWYIYNQDYTRYLQVGINADQVVALYTNSPYLTLIAGVTADDTKQTIEQRYGQPLTEIRKGNTIFQYNDSGQEYGLYLLEGVYATIFYDIHNEHRVTAIQLIAEETERAFAQFYGEASEALQASFERQAFDLTNAVRALAELDVLSWDDRIAATARKHSQDMVARKYFAHQSPEGKSPFDRMKADGLTYKLASENIAAGQTNAIFAHEGWMNSLGHRENILGEYSHLGVGITFGGPFHIYFTQNFLQNQS